MKLSDIFSYLTNGEMAQLYTGDRDEDGVDEDHQRALGQSVQLALNALYTRFNLRENTLELQLMEGQGEYRLESKFAVNGKRTTEPKRWIIDTPAAPFLDDILKIESVVTPVGIELDLNNRNNPYSLMTPRINVLTLPRDMVYVTSATPEYLKTGWLQVAYKANHPAIIPRAGYFNPDSIEVELPTSHLQALLYYVASRAHNPVGMGNEFNAGNQWYQKYELECQRLEAEGMEVDLSSQINRIYQKGFV